MVANIQRIPFHDDELLVVTDERTGKEYVLPKPMVEMLGLQWRAQLAKLTKNKVFSKGVLKSNIPTAGGVQEAVLLERRFVHVWLLSIDVNRVADGLQAKLLRYQEECADALDAYFEKGIAVRPSISKSQASPAPLLHELPIQEQIAGLRCALDFLDEIGMLDARDKLMVADVIRTEIQRQHGQAHPDQKALPSPSGFFLSDRLRALGYALTRKEEASLMSQGLARAVSKEYQQQHGEKPTQSARFVDGAVRPVFWYPEENAAWIDPIIQIWCARAGFTL